MTCRTTFPISILAHYASPVASGLAAGQEGSNAFAENFGTVVQLTPAAAEQITLLHSQGRFGGDVAVRIEPARAIGGQVAVAFDFPLADGRDWIGSSGGIPIVIDRRSAPELLGSTIDFREGQFVQMK
ncbi:hypothetical protein NA78x_004802 [Anatilimnocola sp. NA78]|uniref:hypothetical protein n=1 Tax=Anatilimnocola sp. NA78 TaxID=3415683 RepID=UPI003CE450F0